MIAESHGGPVEQVGELDDRLVAKLVEPHRPLEIVARVQSKRPVWFPLLKLPGEKVTCHAQKTKANSFPEVEINL